MGGGLKPDGINHQQRGEELLDRLVFRGAFFLLGRIYLSLLESFSGIMAIGMHMLSGISSRFWVRYLPTIRVYVVMMKHVPLSPSPPPPFFGGVGGVFCQTTYTYIHTPIKAFIGKPTEQCNSPSHPLVHITYIVSFHLSIFPSVKRRRRATWDVCNVHEANGFDTKGADHSQAAGSPPHSRCPRSGLLMLLWKGSSPLVWFDLV